MAAIRVLIADEFPVVRFGLRLVLENSADIELIGEAKNGKEAIELTQSLSPDVLLLSLELPIVSGFKVVMRLRDLGASTRILVFDKQEDTRVILELMQMGVCGYLLKEETAKAILDAVRGAAKGERGWLSRRIVNLISAHLSTERNEHRELTYREKQVLTEIIGGMSNQAIAHNLGISQKTVEKHVSNIFSRLGVNSRTQAAVIASKEHLLEEYLH